MQPSPQSSQQSFTAFAREKEGRGASRRLRVTGRAPGIVYGGADKPQERAKPGRLGSGCLASNAREFTRFALVFQPLSSFEDGDRHLHAVSANRFLEFIEFALAESQSGVIRIGPHSLDWNFS